MPLVSGFTLRFFEFSTAVAVADRSRIGHETHVYVGIARAGTCAWTTIIMIFHRASRSKKEEARSRRGPANCHGRGQLLMASHPLDNPEHG
ncbi:unnamed protein product [Heterotrigona itama]|uniref:Uncharacterized protein n=1 Tax=Heterotrigona itama TaxID=395501 RepID=A0A6V7H4L5_9HYME|nr:unnamed protein product [Heterotrigona itama]